MECSARFIFGRRQTAVLCLLVVGLLPLAGQAADDPLFDLDLTEVLNLEITSVSKKPQTVSQAAAAVFVITADDIRRSGATTIPDLLRMVPGVQVGQISSNTWAVSSRGVDGRFTNKLLVLMDGRSVYSPTFSGVYWDVQDAVIEDIERIEVIRGPGATLWGANAVNGVINIITRSAASTQGGLLAGRAGDDERGGAVRYGGSFGELGHWRAYAKGFSRDPAVVEATGKSAGDSWRQARAGFRADLTPTTRDAVTLQGDYYRGRSGELSNLNFVIPPYNAIAETDQKLAGGNLTLRWQREVSASDSFTLQAYVDYTRRDWPLHFDERRTTYDLDFQYRSRHFSGHDLVAGLAYRYSRDALHPSYRGVPAASLVYPDVQPASAERRLLSAFLQDDIALVPEKLILTLGGKFEKNDYTGVEFQPNARLLWTPSEGTSLWTSVAKAVRTPSRIDRGGYVNVQLLPPSMTLPLPVLVQGAGIVDSESLIAYEVGVKQRFSKTLSADLSIYYNEYDKLRSGRLIGLLCMPARAPVPGCLLQPGQSYLLQSSLVANEARARSHGVELALDWRPLSTLRFQAALSQQSMSVQEKGSAFSTDREESAPEVQASLRAMWNPRSSVDVDFWLRRVGRLADVGAGVAIPAYTELDARLAWRPRKDVELALIGRNLLHRSHPEFRSELQDIPSLEVVRSVAGQVTWKF